MADVVYKVTVIGDSGVGKSAMYRRWVKGTFNAHPLATVGCDMDVVTHDVGDGRRLRLHLWDTAGQERFAVASNACYRGADAFIIVDEANHIASARQRVDRWLEEAKRNGPDHALLFLVLNKIDIIAGDSGATRDAAVAQVESLMEAAGFDGEFLAQFAGQRAHVVSAKTDDDAGMLDLLGALTSGLVENEKRAGVGRDLRLAGVIGLADAFPPFYQERAAVAAAAGASAPVPKAKVVQRDACLC